VLAAASSLYLITRAQSAGLNLASMGAQHALFFLLLALFLIAYSHRMVGHVSILSVIAQTSVVLHFFAFTAWIGCLVPFLQLSQATDIETLRCALKRFGDNAVVILLVLFAAGVGMLLELLHSPMELVTTNYGAALIIKFVLVLAILCVAALNKLYLVPALGNENSVAKLQRSIRYEICLAFFILLITSYLSTIIGPAVH
jgi:putative copper resistance protein D